MTTLDRGQIEALIPHRDPFLLIDRVTELEPGVRAVAEHTFTGKEWYQAGHFPGNPIVPGVILVESMAQCVPLDAEILTRRGFRRYDDIALGDEVLAYDPQADFCLWTPLRAVSVYADQPTILLSSRSFRALCTSRHTWAVRLHSRRPIHNELIETDALAAHSRHAGNAIVVAAVAESGPIDISERDAAILGWVFTDGWLQVSGDQVRMTITQSKPAHMDDIRSLVGSMGREYVTPGSLRTFPGGRSFPTRDAHRFELRAPYGRDLFARLGIRGKSDLPSLVTRLSSPARRAMLDAMLRAEAHQRVNLNRTGRTFVFGQEDGPVREAFQILCALEGRALGRPQLGPEPGFTRQTLRAHRMVDLGHLRNEPGPVCDVWCPTTDLGTWVMRWNGAVTITGNTATVMAMALPEYRDGLGLFAGIEEMKFKRMVRPGDTARFEAVVDKMRRGFARVNVRTFVGDELAAEGTIIAIFQPSKK